MAVPKKRLKRAEIKRLRDEVKHYNNFLANFEQINFSVGLPKMDTTKRIPFANIKIEKKRYREEYAKKLKIVS